MAMTVSPIDMFGWRPPHVPTRISRSAPSMHSSSNTMPALGHPIPVDCTLIGRPSNVPVKPSMPRSAFTCRKPGSKNVSAMYCARSGSPGQSTFGA